MAVHRKQPKEENEARFFAMLRTCEVSQWDELANTFDALVESARGQLVERAGRVLRSGHLDRLITTSEGCRVFRTLAFDPPPDHQEIAQDTFNEAVVKVFTKLLVHFNRSDAGLTSEEKGLFRKKTIALLVSGEYRWTDRFQSLLWSEVHTLLWTQARRFRRQVRVRFDESDPDEGDLDRTEIELSQQRVRRAVGDDPPLHIAPPDARLEREHEERQVQELLLELLQKAGAAPTFSLLCQSGLGFKDFTPSEVKERASACGFAHHDARKIAARARRLLLGQKSAPESLSRQQIAELLDVSIPQVARYLDRAKVTFKKAAIEQGASEEGSGGPKLLPLRMG